MHGMAYIVVRRPALFGASARGASPISVLAGGFRFALLTVTSLLALSFCATARADQPGVLSIVGYTEDPTAVRLDIASNNTTTLQVTLRRSDNSQISSFILNAASATSPAQTIVTVETKDIGVSWGDVTPVRLDAQGVPTATAPRVPFMAPSYKSGRSAVIDSLTITRPHTFTVQANFDGYDPDGDAVSTTVDFLDASMNRIIRQVIPLGAVANANFIGNSAVDGSKAAYVSISILDAHGNVTTATAAVPPSYPPGDTDNDGKVTIADAARAWRMAQGTDTADAAAIQRSDVHPYPATDGVITPPDIRAIMRFSGGMWRDFPKG